jgi:hypothetical protein
LTACGELAVGRSKIRRQGFYLIGSQTCAKRRSYCDWIDVVGQYREIISVKCDVLLETAIFVVQVVGAERHGCRAVLLLAREAVRAATADA